MQKKQALLFRQLQELGCKGFAVLWDDIEPELSEEDAKHFASFAEAHCKVEHTHIFLVLVGQLPAHQEIVVLGDEQLA